MAQNKNQNISYSQTRITCMVMRYLNFLQQVDSNPKEFDLNKYTSHSSKGFVLQVDLEYPKKLHELHTDYTLAPDKTEIKREMMSEYQLKIADLYNIPTGNVKKLGPNLFDKEKYLIHCENFQFYLRLGLKLIKIYRVLEFN